MSPRVAKRRYQRCGATCAAMPERAHLLEPILPLLKPQRGSTQDMRLERSFKELFVKTMRREL